MSAKFGDVWSKFKEKSRYSSSRATAGRGSVRPRQKARPHPLNERLKAQVGFWRSPACLTLTFSLHLRLGITFVYPCFLSVT